MGFADSVADVNKKYPGAIPDLNSKTVYAHPHISTGSFVIDWCTGIGGIPLGKITELHGQEASGKSTLALMAAAECQAQGMGVLYLDYEHSFDPTYAKILGVDLGSSLFALHQPMSLEDGVRIGEFFLKNAGMVIADSVSAMAPADEVDEKVEVGDTRPIGEQARKIALVLRQMKPRIHQHQVAWIFINQLRQVIDLSFAGQLAARYGPRQTTSGGRALKHYADMRIEFMPKRAVKEEITSPISQEKEKRVVGQNVRITVVKNKCAVPYRSGEIYLRHGQGIDSTVTCLQLAVKFGIIKKKTSYFHVPQPFCGDDMLEKTIQGEAALYSFFEEQPALLKILFKAVWDKIQESGL